MKIQKLQMSTNLDENAKERAGNAEKRKQLGYGRNNYSLATDEGGNVNCENDPGEVKALDEADFACRIAPPSAARPE
jgi:hypothetical protein